jgi:hypothetical protein
VKLAGRQRGIRTSTFIRNSKCTPYLALRACADRTVVIESLVENRRKVDNVRLSLCNGIPIYAP